MKGGRGGAVLASASFFGRSGLRSRGRQLYIGTYSLTEESGRGILVPVILISEDDLCNFVASFGRVLDGRDVLVGRPLLSFKGSSYSLGFAEQVIG
jgi:hypothetical protein